MRRRGIGGPGIGRRRGPSLIGVAATMAVVAGTAGAVSHHQQQKYANQSAQQQAANQQDAQMDQIAQQQAMQQQQLDQMQGQQAPPPPGGMTDDKIVRLQKLGELKTAGILTEEEFAAEKAKILAS